MPHLLIVDQHQFGYLTDTFRYCVHLRERWELTVVCWDYGRTRVELEGVRVHYVSRSGSRPRRLARFLGAGVRQIRSCGADIAFIVYFAGCSLLRVVSGRTPLVMDVRTGADRGGRSRRRFDDALLRIENALFAHRTIISQSLAEKLKLHNAAMHILPLGGDPLPIARKSFETLRLLYVGTLFRRDLEKTVEGMELFLRESPDVDLTYDIVGTGPPEYQRRLKEAIARSEFRSRIRFHGPIPNADLGPFLERANVGVAFIPLVDYYDCQPSTKVFESLLAGMPVLATATSENRRVVTDRNGVLFPDTPEGFADGLRRLVAIRSRLDSDQIRATVAEYSWQRIVSENLEPFLVERIHPREPLGEDRASLRRGERQRPLTTTAKTRTP
jgi:glycosyltransferase involved in cell wall biosynthesis